MCVSLALGLFYYINICISVIIYLFFYEIYFSLYYCNYTNIKKTICLMGWMALTEDSPLLLEKNVRWDITSSCHINHLDVDQNKTIFFYNDRYGIPKLYIL